MVYSVVAYVVLALSIVALVSWRYRSIVNPIAYFSALYLLQTAVAPLLLTSDVREDVQIATVGCSALYFACIALPFLIRLSPLRKPLDFAQNVLLPQELPTGGFTYVFFAAEFLLLFGVLIVTSGTTDWLVSPRTAYQAHRAGVGVWWAFSQGALITLLAAFLVKQKRGPIATVAVCVTISCVAFLLGSKGYMLSPFVLAIFYYDRFVARIPRWAVLAAVLMAVVAISVLQLLQGTAETVADTVAYFDYFGNAALFLDGVGSRFDYTYGATWLSSFWTYVPRGLFPDKPYAYGIAAVMEDFTPGAAEQGSTAGILPWVASYLDFGVFGVILEGLIIGFVSKAVFENLRGQPSMRALLIYSHLGLQMGQPIYGAPFPLFWLWLAAQMFVVRLAFMARNDMYRLYRSTGLLRPRAALRASDAG